MRIRSLLSLSLLTTAAAAAIALAAPTPAPAPASAVKAPELTRQQLDFFETKVRPVLAANCYRCHSIESGKAKGDLTLDTREGWQKGGENGPVIIPGDPAKSRLITAIGYHDADLQMPPKGEKLADKEIGDLTAWVKMGAPDPRVPSAGSKLTGLNDKARAHWAYQPVKKPDVPQVKDAAWVKSPVDSFILAKLEQNGMKPSAPAARETLIRRATYDLLGLPPTPEEVKAFVEDKSPNAFEKVVDRLLASPHYGERWGRFWLDSARYADTTGYEGGNLRGTDYRYAHAWTYRDYVIKAFNDDKPYDQFLKEQLAADQLSESKQDPSRLAALGFITLGKRFQNPNDQIDEHIDTLGKSMLGLTVACARCHDHKFDPIPQADYYSLHGIFASTIEPPTKPVIGKPADEAAYAEFTKKLAELQQQNLSAYYDLVVDRGTEFRKRADGYLLAGLFSRQFNRANELNRIKLIQEFKLDKELYQQFRVRPRDISVFGPLIKFADVPEDEFEAKAPAILAEIASGKIAVNFKGPARPQPINPRIVAAFKDVSAESLKSIRDVAAVYGKLFTEIDAQAKAFVEANRAATKEAPSGFDPAFVELAQIPATVHPAFELTTDEQRLKDAIQELPQQNGGAYRKFNFTEINELELTHPGAPPVAMVVADAPQIKSSPIFIRGEAQNRGPIVPHRFLECLAGPNRPTFTQGSGRLELAEAIASKKNPITARVAINRLWMHHFGEGFVRTPDDLGVQSEPPSHPELLDYLAWRFMQDGWSMKKMHRLVMLSSAYQQSSDNNPIYSAKDSENRLLWRQNLRRLDFEAIRDTMLQFTGKIDLSIGGKPVNLTDEPYSYRRSVYGYVDRGQLPELMGQFDFADPDMANSRRATTIVPAQALFFMNSPMSVDVARKITTRPEFTSATDDAGRVRAIYEVVFQRLPRPEEVRDAADFIAAEQGSTHGVIAKAVPGPGMKRPPMNKQPAAGGNKKNANNARAPVRNEGDLVERKPLTPWELYTQALLMTNEMAYVN